MYDVTAAFPRPLDAEALESGNLRPETLWLRNSTISWGDLGLSGSGRLEVAPDGTPTGEIALKADDWRQLLRAAVSAGAVPGNLEGALEAGLGLMSSLTTPTVTLKLCTSSAPCSTVWKYLSVGGPMSSLAQTGT